MNIRPITTNYNKGYAYTPPKDHNLANNKNNISFKSTEGKMIGGAVGIIGGGLVGLLAVAATGGLAIPFLVPYYAGMAATTAVAVKVGDKLTGKDDDSIAPGDN